MSKIDDKLNEVLDIANDVTVEEVKTLPTVPEDKDPDIDFEITVKIFTICLIGNNELIDNILELSKDKRTSSCLRSSRTTN